MPASVVVFDTECEQLLVVLFELLLATFLVFVGFAPVAQPGFVWDEVDGRIEALEVTAGVALGVVAEDHGQRGRLVFALGGAAHDACRVNRCVFGGASAGRTLSTLRVVDGSGEDGAFGDAFCHETSEAAD